MIDAVIAVVYSALGWAVCAAITIVLLAFPVAALIDALILLSERARLIDEAGILMHIARRLSRPRTPPPPRAVRARIRTARRR
jgi:hypothetical protein